MRIASFTWATLTGTDQGERKSSADGLPLRPQAWAWFALLRLFAARVLVGASILAAWTPSVRAADSTSIESIATWTFGEAEDVNYDAWPDAWRRLTDRDHPAYLKMRIVPHQENLEKPSRQADAETYGYLNLLSRWFPKLIEEPPANFWSERLDRFLKIELNVGAVWMESPKFPVSDDFNYSLTAMVKTEGLKRDDAWCELVFFDGSQQPLSVVSSGHTSGTEDWHRIYAGPAPTPPGAAWVAVRIRVAPMVGRSDIRGVVGFDQLELKRFPQLLLDSDDPTGVYPEGTRPKVFCRLSGLTQDGADVRFTLTDVYGQTVMTHTAAAEVGNAAVDGFYSGEVTWQPEIARPGWYSVSAELFSRDTGLGSTNAHSRPHRTLVILGKLPRAVATPFGISLAGVQSNVPIQRLPAWIEELRVGWVKMDCWLPPNDRLASDQMAWLTERLSDRGIRTVGVLAQPPDALRSQFPGVGNLPASTLFRELSVWQPLLEPRCRDLVFASTGGRSVRMAI